MRHKSMIYKVICKVQKLVKAHKQQKESQEPSRKGWKKRATNNLPLIYDALVVPLWFSQRGYHGPSFEI